MEVLVMALGRRNKVRQQELFVAADNLPTSDGHVFYAKLNQLLADADFDTWIESVCEPYYKSQGRPGIPPGVYFRMLLVGYFEGIQSQRGIAWRCADSLSLRKFLGIALTENTPDHSSLTHIRERLPQSVHEAVFEWVLRIAIDKKLLQGSSVAIDSTTLEADAAMKSIIRRDTGQDWRAYVIGLMRSQGVIDTKHEPTDQEIRNFDKKRMGKTVSNEDWTSPTDPDACITRMKDGTTHMAYKAEHVVDLKTGMVLASEIHPGTASDTFTMEDSLHAAQIHLNAAGSSTEIRDVAADKGYHSTNTLHQLAQYTNFRTYVPEPKQPKGRNWKKRTKHERRAIEANRKRMKSKKGKNLQRQRSEKVERSFAHILETGGARRTRLRGTEKVQKRHLIAAAAFNLGIVMRLLFGIGTARGLQGMARAILACLNTLQVRLWPIQTLPNRSLRKIDDNRGPVSILLLLPVVPRRRVQISICSTGC
jgi:transposase